MKMKLKLHKIFPTLKKPITEYSMEEKIPQSLINKSESLSKTIENFKNLKLYTFRNYRRKKNDNNFNKTLTLKDGDYISSLYSSYNQNYAEEELGNKYRLNSELNEFQKTTIQNFFRSSHKDNSILARSVDNKEMYKNPFKSQYALNFNNTIYKTLNNIRMESQFNSYSKRINEYHLKEKMIKLMPRITISKITSENNNKIKTSIKKKFNSHIQRTKSQDEDLPTLNSSKILPRDDLINNLSVHQNKIETLYHPTSRGQFSLCKTEDNLIYIFGGIQSKFLNDIWICSIGTKNITEQEIKKSKNKINSENEYIKWRKIILSDDELPISRYGHSMTYYMNNLYIFGGILPRNIFRDQEENICIFDMKRENFYYPKCVNHKNVKFRRNHIGIGIGSTMFIHGGIDDDGNYLNDMWIFDCLKYKWSPLIYRNLIKIPKIAYHSSTLVIKNKSLFYHKDLNIYKFPESSISKGKIGKVKIEGIYIFGGIDKERNYYKKLWLIRIGVKPVDIVEIPTHGIEPLPRINCGMCFFNMLNLICVYGGKNDEINKGNLLNDIWFFDLENFNWIHPLYNQEKVYSVAEHVIINDGNKILVLGGFSNDGYVKFDVNTIEFDVLNLVENENTLKQLLN